METTWKLRIDPPDLLHMCARRDRPAELSEIDGRSGRGCGQRRLVTTRDSLYGSYRLRDAVQVADVDQPAIPEEPARDRVIEGVPTIATDLFGEIPAPTTVSDLLAVVAQMSSHGSAIVGWRGQADLEWPVHSSAVRRVKQFGRVPLELQSLATDLGPGLPQIDPDDPDALDIYLLEYESYLLSEARRAGHDRVEGRELSDLELLARLQHYGAATRLLDFSTSVAVAFWFACADHPDKPGLLMAIESTNTRQLLTVAETSKTVRGLMQDHLWAFIWRPLQAFERMRIQQSFFVFSRIKSHKWGSVSLPSPGDPGGLSLVAIPPELKSDALKLHGQRMFGLTGLTLFPDLEGFSRYQSASAPFLSLR
jgi:hypothetical protein